MCLIYVVCASAAKARADSVTGMEVEREREREGGDESPAFVLALGLFAGVFCSTVSIVLYVLHQTPKGSTHGIIQKISYFLGAVVGLVFTFLFGWKLFNKCRRG